MTALIFNCDFNGLALIQELGRRGVDVRALDTVRSVGTVSRYARFHRCPDPLVAERAFVDFLMELGSAFQSRPVLFPTNDHWAAAVSRHREELARLYHPCVAAWSTVELVIRKDRFARWAEAAGYPVPHSWDAMSYGSVPEDAFPLAAKPIFRRISSDDAEGTRHAAERERLRFAVFRNRAELERFSKDHRDRLNGFLLQEYVEGLSDCMFTVGVYANAEHEILGLFSGRKVRGFPPAFGDCMVGQIESVPDELKETVRRLCRELRYEGIGEFEFKRDCRTGAFRLIEVNPRSWSWVGITPFCGVSLPWLAYADLTGRAALPYAESSGATGSVKWVKLLDDLANCLYNNRRAGFPEWSMSPAAWRRSLSADRLVLAEFSKDDPVPAAWALADKARSFVLSAWRAWR